MRQAETYSPKEALEKMRLESLSEREMEVLRRVASGYSNVYIGEKLGMGTRTVVKYLNIAYQKLGLLVEGKTNDHIHLRVWAALIYLAYTTDFPWTLSESGGVTQPDYATTTSLPFRCLQCEEVVTARKVRDGEWKCLSCGFLIEALTEEESDGEA
jgi:DNA-binding CsgD family transcriptional regulator